MIGEDATRSCDSAGDAFPERLALFNCALDELAKLTMTLTATIHQLAFADGARVGGEVESALERAAILTDSLPEGPDGADALRRFHAMRNVARRQLAIAPTPSLTAIAAVKAGNHEEWHDEEQAWIAKRLARGSSPCIPAPSRARRTTRPGTPGAIRRVIDGDDGSAATARTAPNADPSDDRFEDHEP